MSLFLPTIPQANDNLDFSQGQLLSNNSGLDTVFGIDHYQFSDATANKGKHKQCHFVEQAASPGTAVDEAAIYTKNVAATSANEIFIQRESTAPAGSDIQLSLFSKGVTAASTGTSWLPGGILVLWGFVNNGTDNQTITFQNGGFPTACFQVLMTPIAAATANTASNVSAVTQTNFVFRTGSGSLTGFYWFAIGN